MRGIQHFTLADLRKSLPKTKNSVVCNSISVSQGAERSVEAAGPDGLTPAEKPEAQASGAKRRRPATLR